LPADHRDEIADARRVADGDANRGERRDDEAGIQLALFRYGVIGPLVERAQYEPGEITRLVAEIAAATHYLPGTGAVRVGRRTIYTWLQRHRKGGIEALRPCSRKDRGTRRAASDEVLARAVALRKEQPGRKTNVLLDILVHEGSKVPSRSTLDRHLRRLCASRRHLRTLGEKRTIKMRFDKFGRLWVGDYHHGPLVVTPDRRLVAAKLSGIIDHTTRYPVADRWYIDENNTSLRDCFMRALLRWGPCDVFYADRGKVYRADQLAYSLAHLGAKLVHSRAYYSQGRGVIERWWQHANDFEAEINLRAEPPTIHELNALWEAWRELRYCQQVHSELGKTPNEAIADVEPRPLAIELVRDIFLCRCDRTVHRKDACVDVLGRRYLCESFLRGQKVIVRYDPAELDSVLIFFEGKKVQRAFPQPINATPEPHPPSAEATAERTAPSVDYLALLRDDFDRRLLEHAKPLAYAELAPSPGFDRTAFVAAVVDLAGVERRKPLVRELESFWEIYGPLPEQLVRVATEHAVRLHGRGRHPRIYLHAIRTLVLAELKTKPTTHRPDQGSEPP
jgi:transposase InsO family protein